MSTTIFFINVYMHKYLYNMIWEKYCKFFHIRPTEDAREIFLYKMYKLKQGDKKWCKNNPNFCFFINYCI